VAETSVEAAFVGRNLALGIHETTDGGVGWLKVLVPCALGPDGGTLTVPVLAADELASPDILRKLAELLTSCVDPVCARTCARLAVVLNRCRVAGRQMPGSGEASVRVADSAEAWESCLSGESSLSGESRVYESSGLTWEPRLYKRLLSETWSLSESLLAESSLAKSTRVYKSGLAR